MRDFRDIIEEGSGTYALVMLLSRPTTITPGRLAPARFKTGHYLYTGSAFGPGGLKARVGRHLKPLKKRHWHIDYLCRFAEIVEIWYTNHPENVECRWADIIRQTRGVQMPLPGFGSSDCQCMSHLFYTRKKPGFATFNKKTETTARVWRPKRT